eukprot:CAMPEP_0113494422 /NCGR_PEP_ID=MMETSP0014_2-20120614/29098_1 /TAXON_ID=2857 /ORGANISM="Nitzschia sp." /LENGTH=487 /DNA_ID=CAMNT_0000388313 /DNA_START=199 /DNA_END=1662 /DNA_ORIENTATION=- /assembly_acc=CAM_ASM_000159
MMFSRGILATVLLGATAMNNNIHVVSSAAVLSECNSRLPMSLSTVVSDLETEGVSKVTTASFLTSRGVTAARRSAVLGLEDPSSTSFGTDTGVCLAISQPSSMSEVASAAAACDGNIIFYPDENDLERGEGLFDSLGPAMERILNDDQDGSSRSLLVVSSSPQKTKQVVEKAAADVLSNLVSAGNKKVSTLDELFDEVHYVSSVEEAMKKLKADKESASVQERIASAVASDFLQTSPASFASSMSSRDLAAAWTLGPVARKAFSDAIDTVKSIATGQLVKDFRGLSESAIKVALEKLDDAAGPELASTKVGKQIRADLKDELSGEFSDLATFQLSLLQEACFVDFKGKLSKLKLSPNLPTDMQDVVKESVSEFVKASKSVSTDSSDMKVSYQTRLQDFCAERLLAARASGQYRPLPKKGVQIGLHWLLPKPFGNDYRQEPWLVQATDNMVYVPHDKITDVNPSDVASGDWRNSVVPAPAGNEIIYMQ